MGYLKQTIKGFSWMGGLRVSTRALTFVKLAVLARLLAPEQFGLFGIASLVLAFLEIVTETGINIFLIQEKRNLKDYVDTAWIISIIRGATISITLFIFSPVVASFFDSPEALRLIWLISLVPLIRGFINPSIVRFQKDLMFSCEFGLRLTVFIIDTTAAIVFAFVTGSAASLVCGLIFGALAEVILSFIVVSPRPKLSFEIVKAKQIINRGKWVNMAIVFNYIFQEGDDIVIGRLLNTFSLGIYQMAYKISSLPITEVSDVVMKVTFPVFVRISGDKARLRKAFLKTLAVVSILTLPFGILLLLYPESLVLLILGDQWIAAIPVIRILSLFGVVRAITACTYPVFLSLKKQEYVTIITLAGVIGLIATIIPFVRSYGIEGAGISALIGSSVALPVSLFFLLKVFRQ